MSFNVVQFAIGERALKNECQELCGNLLAESLVKIFLNIQCESKNPPCGFPKRLGICNKFFTHLLYVHIYVRLQIFIQLSPILTTLWHTKRDHPSNSLELNL